MMVIKFDSKLSRCLRTTTWEKHSRIPDIEN